MQKVTKPDIPKKLDDQKAILRQIEKNTSVLANLSNVKNAVSELAVSLKRTGKSKQQATTPKRPVVERLRGPGGRFISASNLHQATSVNPIPNKVATSIDKKQDDELDQPQSQKRPEKISVDVNVKQEKLKAEPVKKEKLPQSVANTERKTTGINSADTLQAERQKQDKEKDSRSLIETLREGLKKGIGFARNPLGLDMKDDDVTDKAMSIGGPFWESFKEIKAMTGELAEKGAAIKERFSTGKDPESEDEPPPLAAKPDKNGKLRDEKGQFLTAEAIEKLAKPAQESRQDDDDEGSENIVDAIQKSENEADKRNRTLIRAIGSIETGGSGGISPFDFLPGGKKGGKKGLLKGIGSKAKGFVGKTAGLFKGAGGKLAGAVGLGGLGAVSKMGGKGIGGLAAKTGGKGLGKSVLKKIPGIGLLAGLGFGAKRLFDSKGSDITGALGEIASGLASTIPGVGTAVSVAIDAGLAARDIAKETDNPSNEKEKIIANPISNTPGEVNGTPLKPQQASVEKVFFPNPAPLQPDQGVIASQSVPGGPGQSHAPLTGRSKKDSTKQLDDILRTLEKGFANGSKRSGQTITIPSGFDDSLLTLISLDRI